MGIEKTIKNMEAALEKKKAVMREKSVAKITKLKERIQAKTLKIDKLTEERTSLETECMELVVDQSVAGTETKTEIFVPGATPEGDQKDDHKKNPHKKNPHKKKS